MLMTSELLTPVQTCIWRTEIIDCMPSWTSRFSDNYSLSRVNINLNVIDNGRIFSSMTQLTCCCSYTCTYSLPRSWVRPLPTLTNGWRGHSNWTSTWVRVWNDYERVTRNRCNWSNVDNQDVSERHTGVQLALYLLLRQSRQERRSPPVPHLWSSGSS